MVKPEDWQACQIQRELEQRRRVEVFLSELLERTLCYLQARCPYCSSVVDLLAGRNQYDLTINDDYCRRAGRFQQYEPLVHTSNIYSGLCGRLLLRPDSWPKLRSLIVVAGGSCAQGFFDEPENWI